MDGLHDDANALPYPPTQSVISYISSHQLGAVISPVIRFKS